MVWKWQELFLWESPLVNGYVPGFHVFDAQATCCIPKAHASLKLGGTNILNKPYIQMQAAPPLAAYTIWL